MVLFVGYAVTCCTCSCCHWSGTCDVSLHTGCQPALKVSVSQWAMLWELSAVKACVRCVGVLALALGLMLRFMPHEAAGMYRNWRKRHTTANLAPFPPLLLLTSLPIVPSFLSYYLFCSSVTVFCLSDPCRQVFWIQTKDWWVLFMWLRTSQAKPLAKKQL